MTRVINIMCDLCEKEITKNQYHVDASVYEADFHNSCFIEASAEDLVVALNLDDISIGLVGNERMEKLTAHIRKNRR